LIADASLLVDDIPWFKAEFSFESFLTANGVEDAIPFIRLFEFVVVVVVDDTGKEVVVVKDFRVGSWLCERIFLDVNEDDVGDVGDKFVVVVVVDSFVIDGGLCSNRDMRPREPSIPVDVDCWALSCNFWSSDRWESSIDVCW